MVIFSILYLALILQLWYFPTSAQLTNDWTSGKLYTALAQRIKKHWMNCSQNFVFHQFKNWGFGSELHMWSQALCNSLQRQATLQQLDQSWVWNDRKHCADRELQPLRCYFNITNHCDISRSPDRPIIDYKNDLGNCPDWIADDSSRQSFRAACMEILFSQLSSDIVAEAQNVSRALFGPDSTPKDMLMVHIRWGDKASEMRLVDIQSYINALSNLVKDHNIASPTVFVVTESLDARKKLDEEIAKQSLSWRTVHYDPPEAQQPVHERIPVRAAYASDGATGKASLISLLIALESKYYVLTTGSNWSRLINELRLNRVDPKCGNCTSMVDMQQAHKFHNWRP